MRTKICGITRLEDALFAAEQGAFALGFNFYPKSPRYIHPEQAKLIIHQLPSSVLTVGIFIDTPYSVIKITMDTLGLSLAQVNHDLDCPSTFKKHIILSLQAATLDDIPLHTILRDYGYILLDAPHDSDGLLGGTGRKSNWELAHQLAQKYRCILAGGLNLGNVEQAIHEVKPFMVDVASGIELSPGIKDQTLTQAFLRKVNHAQ